MKPQFSRLPGCVTFLLVLLIPAAGMAYVLRNPAWLLAVPLGILGLMFAFAFVMGLLAEVLGVGRRKCTPEEFASALEKHLIGDEEPYDWDDATCVALADPRLERIRQRLGPNLDALAREEDKDELRGIIAALRSGDLADVQPRRRIINLFNFRK